MPSTMKMSVNNGTSLLQILNDSMKQNFKDLSMFPIKRFRDDISVEIETLHDFELGDLY